MFSSYLLHDPISAALAKMGITEPTEVQQACLPPALDYRDMLVSARTGSGKTLAFLIPLVQHLLDDNGRKHGLQALILAPTRELARQINKQCSLLCEFTALNSTVIIGGEDPKHQLLRLKKSPEIIIATPGRLLEHINREAIDPGDIQVLVLDEADRMLSLGFSEAVREIAAWCNPQRQTMLFSASLNHQHFKPLVDVLLHEPETIILDTIRDTHENIRHQYVLADDHAHKQKLLLHFASQAQAGDKKILVFANTRPHVEQLGRFLQQQAVAAGTLHGDLDQAQRNTIVAKLRNNQIQVLVATDVAARGLDIPAIDTVIHFDLPHNGEEYAHRSGRTGRADNTGFAVAFINASEWNPMVSIENFLHTKFERLDISGLEGAYRGPEKLKTSGKAAGKDKKAKTGRRQTKKKTIKKKKNRLRDRKNIGKRRQPTVKDDQQQA